MQSPDSNMFGDRKMWIGILLIFGFMVGWQWFLSKRYPDANKPPQAASPKQVEHTSVPSGASPEKTAAGVPVAPPAAAVRAAVPEKTFTYEDDRVRFTVSSRGLGLQDFVLKSYKDHAGQPIRLGFSPLGWLFEARLKNGPIDFDLRETASGTWEGTAQTPAGKIRRQLIYDKQKTSFESLITIDGATAELGNGLLVIVPDTVRASGSSSWLFPSYEHQNFLVGHAGTTTSLNVNHAKENVRGDYEGASFLSLGDQYFSSAVLDRSDVIPSATASADVAAKTAMGELIYQPHQPSGTVQFRQILYAGPKSIDVLQKIDPAMASIIDFGFLKVIAKPLLWVMKWFYSYVGNWGLAIILLTLLVRFIVLPFNLMSVRSMKAMQKIQPLMAQVRERYKDDPMAQQREMMSLMKEHKANPLGGCLPMLLQIPIFFALFRVVGSSVEIYQAPFFGWIHDLSAHDPFYVLPVLMGVTMFLQSKLTPTTMDPAQAKIMQWLPLVFTAFMLQLPAGLALYMVVSSIFGVTQQWFVMRDGNKAPVPVAK